MEIPEDNLYLQSSEAKAVEQRQSDQAAQDAVDRRDEAGRSWGVRSEYKEV